MPEPFSPEQQATLQITMHVVSVISMVACIAVFVVLFRFERLQTMMNKMIAWLTLCDFFLSLAFAFGTYPIRNSVACTIQGKWTSNECHTRERSVPLTKNQGPSLSLCLLHLPHGTSAFRCIAIY
ncbi:hypothetical protein BCR33DRAFT_425256 [Rhizoclosmatium globosum]|uniref:Uncharacterized protein n=1 Tax=Rhizoclosmatium globosum TaxID=329046 RepID=A0A1Y2BUV8_9FUNG|nr:hypothetical protein BCR33DRAFT_425256 [Rhizoclosmatium globosum]|eukprot:ORY38552.1 hypothetical protein BCR33DRAFT_425256 [Rhizoclosmatium globosum]